MESVENRDFLLKLDTRQEIRTYGYSIRGDDGSEHLIGPEMVDILTEAYENLANGIHESIHGQRLDTHERKSGEPSPLGELLISMLTNRREAMTRSYDIPSLKHEPSYVTNYGHVSWLVYGVILDDALMRGDFGLMISTVTAFEDPSMAQDLLDRMSERIDKTPDMVIGDVDEVMGGIYRNNDRVDAFKNAVETYVITEAHRDRAYEFHRKLNRKDTGVLGALAIGLRLKLKPGVNKNKALEKYFFKPLREIASMPPIIEQLTQKEKAAIPLDLVV